MNLVCLHLWFLRFGPFEFRKSIAALQARAVDYSAVDYMFDS